jgi:hypothetical protein
MDLTRPDPVPTQPFPVRVIRIETEGLDDVAVCHEEVALVAQVATAALVA